MQWPGRFLQRRAGISIVLRISGTSEYHTGTLNITTWITSNWTSNSLLQKGRHSSTWQTENSDLHECSHKPLIEAIQISGGKPSARSKLIFLKWFSRYEAANRSFVSRPPVFVCSCWYSHQVNTNSHYWASLLPETARVHWPEFLVVSSGNTRPYQIKPQILKSESALVMLLSSLSLNYPCCSHYFLIPLTLDPNRTSNWFSIWHWCTGCLVQYSCYLETADRPGCSWPSPLPAPPRSVRDCARQLGQWVLSVL